MFDNLSRNEKLLGLLLLFLALSRLLNNEPSLFILLIVLATLYGLRNYHQDQQAEARQQEPIEQQPARRASPDAETVRDHALTAVRRAGLEPEEVQVLPVDIGLFSFHGDDEPVIHRNWPVYDDSDYIQPFVQLRVPVAAVGRVRFEIYDQAGELVFVNENRYHLKRGRNLVIPSTRLPVHDQHDTGGGWELRIIADNTLLARHRFEWAETESDSLTRHIGEDGEISSELRAVLAESRLGEMSLDELLAHQEAEEEARQRQS
jgi:hypothetical protein